ncbi:MAG: hypothetical protein IIA66_07865 [Planctomycetes bacterium]|nr:hypothetical protein [Planctomycetota bacterium]
MINVRPSQFAILVIAVLVSGTSSGALAQEGSTPNEPVTREEFLKLLGEFRQFRKEYATLKSENAELKNGLAAMNGRLFTLTEEGLRAQIAEAAAQEREYLLRELRAETRIQIDSLLPGLTNFALGGGGVVAYQDRENSDSTFALGIAPLVLWKPTDDLLFEVEFGFSLGAEETNVELGLAQLSYVLNDYVTIGGGLFRLPFATFWERWHPSWINKLPVIPLLYERGLVGPSGLGVQARGGFALGPTKVNYSAYYINGPDFQTSQVSAGRLGFGNYRDNNNNKGFGFRIGFLPIPEFEVGYSFFTGRVDDSGGTFSDVDTTMQAFDFRYAREFDAIKGRLDLLGEFVWVDTDDEIFTGALLPIVFDNKRRGWFVQAAYRPTQAEFRFGDKFELRNLEFVARYDWLREPGPGSLGTDGQRTTLGLTYWLKPNVAFKVAYVLDDANGDRNQDGFFVQAAFGL